MKFWIYVLIDIIFQLTNSYFITCIIFWVINHFSFFLLKTKVPHKSWNNGRNFPKIGIKPFFGIIFIHWKNKVNCITGRYLTWLPLHDVLACYIVRHDQTVKSKKKTCKISQNAFLCTLLNLNHMSKFNLLKIQTNHWNIFEKTIWTKLLLAQKSTPNLLFRC